MEKQPYKVYVYINKVNYKKYVGQTKKSLKARAKRNGIGYEQCTAFYRAIKKYGWDNFEPMILCDNLTKDEADELEIYFIDKLNTLNPDYGYNITTGGHFSSNTNLMMPVVQFDLNFNYIARYNSLSNAEDATGISKSHIAKTCKGKCKHASGYIWLFEEDYMSGNYDKDNILYLINKEFEHPNSRPVVQCDLDMNYIEEYRNICEASRKTGVRRNCINDNCTHRLKTSSGYIWMYKDEYDSLIDEQEKESISLTAKTTNIKTRKGVVQLDIDMNYIQEFPSILDASKKTGAHRKSIKEVCDGKYKQAKGFIYKYANDYYEAINQNIA